MPNRRAIPIGLSLKFDRMAADVRAMDVAAKMGVSKSRITRIEEAGRIEIDVIARYRKAIEEVLTDRRNAEIQRLAAELEAAG